MSLIEGLPDAIALQCLARVPLGMHRTLRAVCRAWRSAVSGSAADLFRLRAHHGFLEHWLYVTAFEPDRVWEAFDPSSSRWHTLPDLPTPIRHLSNFATACLPGGKLFVIGGGSDDVDIRTGDRDHCAVAIPAVWCFDVLRGSWESRAPMATPRTQFACCAVDGRIVVAGGFGSSRRPLASAEVYDPVLDRWQPAAPLPVTHNASCSGVLLRGAMHVVHKGEGGAQMYDAKADRWDLVGSWGAQVGPMAVVGGEEVCGVANGGICVTRRGVTQVYRSVPEYSYRIGFGVAAVGSDFYVVGGLLGPRPESSMIQVLQDVDVWSLVDGEFVQRQGTRMNWCTGTVLGCAVVAL